MSSGFYIKKIKKHPVYDNAGKNAIVKLTFNSINSIAGSPYFVQEDAEIFKKYVRFAFDPKQASYITDLTTQEVAIVKIIDVLFEKTYTSSTPPLVQNGVKVTLTLDKNLKVSNLPANAKVSLVIGPGNEFYGSKDITFGDFTAIDTVIDGVRGWALYDELTF